MREKLDNKERVGYIFGVESLYTVNCSKITGDTVGLRKMCRSSVCKKNGN